MFTFLTILEKIFEITYTTSLNKKEKTRKKSIQAIGTKSTKISVESIHT